MGRNGVTIYKFSLRGRLVKTYTSVAEAQEKERTSRYFLLKAIANGKPLAGGLFSFTVQPPVLRDRKEELRARVTRKETPWVGSDGMFDIRGWASLF